MSIPLVRRCGVEDDTLAADLDRRFGEERAATNPFIEGGDTGASGAGWDDPAAETGAAMVMADIPTYRELWQDAALFAVGIPSALAASGDGGRTWAQLPTTRRAKSCPRPALPRGFGLSTA